MRTEFVQTSGVKTLLAGVTKAQQRGAREAGWITVQGDRGVGKTRALQWWSMRHQAVYLRMKAEWTPRWLLEELATELGLSVNERNKQALFGKVVAAVRTSETIIVLDEVELEKVRGKIRLLEILRDISDLTETEVIIGGDKDGIRHVLRYDQFASRVAVAVQFPAVTLDDARLLAERLAEVKIAPEVVAEIHRQSGGWLREAKNAVAEVERLARMNGLAEVTLDHVAGRPLCAGRTGKGK
ncbi:MAG: hypothetical protein RLY86_661 [Pseudomonadota bacterium]|jgi:DNA transposition AAA+ family ATPase